MSSWPLAPEQQALLARLAELIGRWGRERFTDAHLVRADAQDFPEPWEATATAVGNLLYRLCWHAHLDVELAVDDQRQPAQPTNQMLSASELELTGVRDGRAHVRLDAIGNDDLAGFASHVIGAAFLELAPGVPFRDAPREVTPRDGSLAAVFLGLGVLVANSASYRRQAQRWEGRRIVSEERVATCGGLSLDEATFLLAVQDVVRDDLQGALATLLPPQAERFAAWRDALEDHEAELRALLELDAAPARPLARPARPRTVSLPEPDLRLFNQGRVTFRVETRMAGVALGGFVIGLAGGVLLVPLPWLAGPVLATAGMLVGRRVTPRHFVCSEPECAALMKTEATTCPGCGGKIVETIAHARLRLERREELEELARSRPDGAASR